jgi:hypothetical protein
MDVSPGYTPPDPMTPYPLDSTPPDQNKKAKEAPAVPNYGTDPHHGGCPGCPGMSCPYPGAGSVCPPASDPVTPPVDADKPAKVKHKRVKKKSATFWESNKIEVRPTHPDIDTMEFGPRDYQRTPFRTGPF